jgi:hypothetical protein
MPRLFLSKNGGWKCPGRLSRDTTRRTHIGALFQGQQLAIQHCEGCGRFSAASAGELSSVCSAGRVCQLGPGAVWWEVGVPVRAGVPPSLGHEHV